MIVALLIFHRCVCDSCPPRAGIAERFGVVLELCARRRLVKVGIVAVDRTQLAAAATHHPTRSMAQIRRGILVDAARTGAAEARPFRAAARRRPAECRRRLEEDWNLSGESSESTRRGTWPGSRTTARGGWLGRGRNMKPTARSAVRPEWRLLYHHSDLRPLPIRTAAPPRDQSMPCDSLQGGAQRLEELRERAECAVAGPNFWRPSTETARRGRERGPSSLDRRQRANDRGVVPLAGPPRWHLPAGDAAHDRGSSS
jgi:hypothetical protein